MREKIKSELKYLAYSARFLVIAVGLIIGIFIIYFVGYQELASICDSYSDTKQLIASGDYFYSDDEYSEEIEAVLSMYETQIAQSYEALSPEYALTYGMEFSVLFFPVVFGLYGLSTGTADYRNNIIKHKVARMGRTAYFVSKLEAMTIVCVMATAVYVIFGILAGSITQSLAYKNVIQQLSNLPEVTISSGVLGKLLFMLGLAFVYSAAGFMLGVIFRKSSVGATIIILHTFVIPILSRFDLKNVSQYIAYQLGDSFCAVSISEVTNTNMVMSVIVMTASFIVFCDIAYLILKKRSAFA